MTKTKIDTIIDKIVKELKNYNPNKIILFGSRADGTFKKTSDIDIAVDFSLNFREKRKLCEKIDMLSGLYSVDLIFLPKVDKNFREKILKEGKILYEKK